MGIPIKALATQFTGLAFNLAGDLVKTATYTQPTSTDYDPIAGVATPSNQTVSVPAMLLTFDEREIDGNRVKLGDERVLIQCSLLTALTPGTDDTITIGGIVRRIIEIEMDGANALYRFHCRREVPA